MDAPDLSKLNGMVFIEFHVGVGELESAEGDVCFLI